MEYRYLPCFKSLPYATLMKDLRSYLFSLTKRNSGFLLLRRALWLLSLWGFCFPGYRRTSQPVSLVPHTSPWSKQKVIFSIPDWWSHARHLDFIPRVLVCKHSFWPEGSKQDYWESFRLDHAGSHAHAEPITAVGGTKAADWWPGTRTQGRGGGLSSSKPWGSPSTSYPCWEAQMENGWGDRMWPHFHPAAFSHLTNSHPEMLPSASAWSWRSFSSIPTSLSSTFTKFRKQAQNRPFEQLPHENLCF